MKLLFYEKLTDKLKAMRPRPILISDNVAEIYNTPISRLSGTNSKSCMRSNADYSCKNGVKFFDVLGLKIAYSLDKDGLLLARALIWDNCRDQKGNAFTFMDRVYGTADVMIYYKEWAHSQGFYYKYEQTYDNRTLIPPKGRKITDYFRPHQIEIIKGNYHPYFDTMLYISDSGAASYQYAGINDNSDTYLFTSCSGSATGIYICSSCGKKIDRNRVVKLSNRFFCNKCTIFESDNYYLKSTCIKTVDNRFLPRDRCVYLTDKRKYISVYGEYKLLYGKHYSIDAVKKCLCGTMILKTEENCLLCTKLKKANYGYY